MTSDHGASFVRGENFRSASQNNYADIMDVPLFIKHPGQHTSAVDTSPLRSIDVIPILFNMLGASYPWETDGGIPSGINAQATVKRTIVTKNGDVKHIIYDPDKKFDTVAWKTSLFGNEGRKGIYGGAEHAHLIGQPARNECLHDVHDIRVSSPGNGYISIKPSSGKTNAFIRIGLPKSSRADSGSIVVSVNSRVAAVLPVASLSGNKDYAYTIIDAELLTPGNNMLSLSSLKTSSVCNNHVLSGR